MIDIVGHLTAFPHAKVAIQDGWIFGTWMIGNNYKRVHGYHGEYPPSYIRRVKTLFPVSPVLHVFSGSVDEPGDVTLDANPDVGADYVVDVKNLSEIVPGSFRLIMADPPYTTADAAKYGPGKMPNKYLAMREIRKIISDDGVLVWLDMRPPIYRKDEWSLTGIIDLYSGTNRWLRGVMIFVPQPGGVA